MITQTGVEDSLTFLRYVILHYGITNSIVKDQGPQFMSDISNGYVKYLNTQVKYYYISPSKKRCVGMNA